jgi:hypothetical protein
MSILLRVAARQRMRLQDLHRQRFRATFCAYLHAAGLRHPTGAGFVIKHGYAVSNQERRPFGNSSGDREMLQWTGAGEARV